MENMFIVLKQPGGIIEATVVKENGKTVEYGTADRVLDHPQDPYTRKLTGGCTKAAKEGTEYEHTFRAEHLTKYLPREEKILLKQ